MHESWGKLSKIPSEGRGNKDFKKGGKLGLGVGALLCVGKTPRPQDQKRIHNNVEKHEYKCPGMITKPSTNKASKFSFM